MVGAKFHVRLMGVTHLVETIKKHDRPRKRPLSFEVWSLWPLKSQAKRLFHCKRQALMKLFCLLLTWDGELDNRRRWLKHV